MLLNTKSLLIENKIIGVLFCPRMYKQSAPSNVFLNGVRVQFFDQVKYLGVWTNASLKDDDDIQRQVKSRLCSKQAQRRFRSVLSCSKKTFYFVYACQLWSKYTQTSMKRLCAAYNNA